LERRGAVDDFVSGEGDVGGKLEKYVKRKTKVPVLLEENKIFSGLEGRDTPGTASRSRATFRSKTFVYRVLSNPIVAAAQ